MNPMPASNPPTSMRGREPRRSISQPTKRPANAAFRRGQGKYEGGRRAAEVEFALDGEEEDGKAAVEDAAGKQGQQATGHQHPPPVIHSGASDAPYPVVDLRQNGDGYKKKAGGQNEQAGQRHNLACPWNERWGR